MSQGAFANPMSPIRDTMGFDRAERYANGYGGASNSNFAGRPGPVSTGLPLMPANAAALAEPPNPGRAINQENASNSDANAYAASAFKRWYGSQKPQDLAQFNTNPTHENAAGIAEQNARQHFMDNVLSQDPQYATIRGGATDARNARFAGQSVQDYQHGQAAVTGARNTANAIQTDAAGRTVVANGQGALLTGQGNEANAQANVLMPAQARGFDAESAARNLTARIAGEQWDQTKPLYPQQLQAGIDETRSKTGLNNAQSDATRAGATTNAVQAFGAANRPTVGKDADGNPVSSPPPVTYGAPTDGSLFPTMTATPQAPRSAAAGGFDWWNDPKNDGSAVATDRTTGAKMKFARGPDGSWRDPTGATFTGGGINFFPTPSPSGPGAPAAPAANQGLIDRMNNAGTPAAPSSPGILDKFASGLKSGSAAIKPSPAWLLGPVGGAIQYGSGFASGFQNPRGAQPGASGAPASAPKSISVGGVNLTQQADGTWAGSNGRRYRTDPTGKFTLVG